MQKHPWPLHDVRHWLEPGAVVLISSRWQDRNNIMTLGWYTVLEFSPSLVGCMISAGNISFDMIRRSGECVINLPDAAMAETVARIGNCDGDAVDKFAAFRLTAEASEQVSAPSIAGNAHLHRRSQGRMCLAQAGIHPPRHRSAAQQQNAHDQQGHTGRQCNDRLVGPGAKARHRTAKSNSCKKENGDYAGQPPTQRRHIGKIHGF